MPRDALNTNASKPGVIFVPSSALSALARATTSCGSEMSAGVILLITSAAVYPSMRSAPTLKIWMTPFSSVAILEKLALLKIAFCKAPAFSRASLRWTSMTTSSVPAAAGMAESWFCADMSQPPSSFLTGISIVEAHVRWGCTLQIVKNIKERNRPILELSVQKGPRRPQPRFGTYQPFLPPRWPQDYIHAAAALGDCA